MIYVYILTDYLNFKDACEHDLAFKYCTVFRWRVWLYNMKHNR